MNQQPMIVSRWIGAALALAMCLPAVSTRADDKPVTQNAPAGANQPGGAPPATDPPPIDKIENPQDRRVPPRYTMPGQREVRFPLGLYSEVADAWTDVREALKRAKQDNRRVLLIWGENNCGFCAYLSDLLWYESPGIRSLLDNEYEVVKIDISKQHNKNNELARRYNATSGLQMQDAPRLTVVNPVLDQGMGTLAGKEMTAKPMSMEKVFDENVILQFLENHRALPKPATDAIDEALKRSMAEQKAVAVFFLQASGSCEECRVWESWLAKPGNEALIGQGLVVARVNPARMTAGQSLMERLSGQRPASPPMIVGLTSRGMKPDTPVMLERFPRNSDDLGRVVDALVRLAGDKATGQWAEQLRVSLSQMLPDQGSENPPADASPTSQKK